MELLIQAYTICRTAAIDNDATLLSVMFAGLAGSASHCIGMCGPFVLSQVGARLEAVPAASMREFSRLSGAALLPYHFGRLTTYGVLGGLAGALAGGMSDFGGFRYLAAALLALAGLLFLGYALHGLRIALPALVPAAGGSGLVGRLAGPLFDHPIGWRGYGLGLVLGFLPCGLLYGALAAAASTGGWVAGTMAMIAFAVGTVPVLVLFALAGQFAANRWRSFAMKLAPVLLVLNGGFLMFLAWQMAT